MNIILNRDELSKLIQNLYKVIECKNGVHLSILRGILITAKDDSVNFNVYNLTTWAQDSMSAKVLEEGSIMLDAKFLTRILLSTNCETITISTASKNIILIKESPSRFFTIEDEYSNKFPKMPIILNDKTTISISQSRLKQLI